MKTISMTIPMTLLMLFAFQSQAATITSACEKAVSDKVYEKFAQDEGLPVSSIRHFVTDEGVYEDANDPENVLTMDLEPITATTTIRWNGSATYKATVAYTTDSCNVLDVQWVSE